MIEIIHTDTREAWLDARTKTVGASEVACLFGVDTFITPFELWMRKSQNLPDNTKETPPMRRGRMLEEVAVKFLREEQPTWTITANTIPGGKFYRDLDAGISCTPDAFAVDPERNGFGVIQIKSIERSIFSRRWKADGEIDPPMHVVIQAIQEAALTGASWAMVAPLVVGFGIEMPLIDVPLHAGIITRIKVEVRSFWERVARKDPPPADYTRDGRLIATLFSETSPGKIIDMSSDNTLPELAAEDNRLADELKQRSDRRKAIKSEIIMKMGDAETALFQGGRVTAKIVRRKSYSVAASQYRDLRIKLET